MSVSTHASDSSNAAVEQPGWSTLSQIDQTVTITSRAVSATETTAAGVVVSTAFLTKNNEPLDMPAVFPDLSYAIDVVDDLKRQIMQHFSEAARVGAKVIVN